MYIRSALLVRKCNPIPLVLPRKLVLAMLLPAVVQALVAKVLAGSLRTRPPVIVSRLSVVAPVWTPGSVRGLAVAITWSAVAGVVVPMPTLPCTIRPFVGAALAR